MNFMNLSSIYVEFKNNQINIPSRFSLLLHFHMCELKMKIILRKENYFDFEKYSKECNLYVICFLNFCRSTLLKSPVFWKWENKYPNISHSMTLANGLSIVLTSSFWYMIHRNWTSDQKQKPFWTNWKAENTKLAFSWTRPIKLSPKSFWEYKALWFGTFPHWCHRLNHQSCTPFHCGAIPSKMEPPFVYCKPKNAHFWTIYAKPLTSVLKIKSPVHVVLLWVFIVIQLYFWYSFYCPNYWYLDSSRLLPKNRFLFSISGAYSQSR